MLYVALLILSGAYLVTKHGETMSLSAGFRKCRESSKGFSTNPLSALLLVLLAAVLVLLYLVNTSNAMFNLRCDSAPSEDCGPTPKMATTLDGPDDNSPGNVHVSHFVHTDPVLPPFVT